MLESWTPWFFIRELLVKNMEISGKKKVLNLKTLNDERSELCVALEKLQVGKVKLNDIWIQLSKINISKHLPGDNDKMATPKITK